ncbi:MAG: hypothetical protein OEW00_14575 [candidate division Zixibacteria bacterium]|nr:hypothetical protein [candidate division Zixibacteria bacterium]
MRKILAFVLLVLVSGCARRPVVYNQPELPSGGYYDLVWVEPSIVMSDSLFTLIGARRIDSIYVKDGTRLLSTAPQSGWFRVGSDSCFASINLLDSKSRVLRPLLARNLGRAYYKFTINPSILASEGFGSGVYFLSVSACDSTFKRPLLVN